MKVILTQNVENLGKRGEEKEVKEGYARNFLLPRSLALTGDDPRGKQLAVEAEKEREKEQKKEWEATEKANAVAGKVVVVKAKAGAKDQLFAAIDEEDIKKAIKEQLESEPEAIKSELIKKLGEHEVYLDYGAGKTAAITLDVQKEEAKAAKKK